MISEEEAREKVLGAISPLAVQQVPLSEALGRFSANNIAAKIPLPSFDNSGMDGYAVVASSTGKGARLRIVGEQPAEASRNLRVSSGEAVRIFTGAPIPTGADAVVMQEETSRDGDYVVIHAQKVVPGEFVRRAGQDLATGQSILERGDRLTATRLALLASQGLALVNIHQSPRVAIITTGSEVVQPGSQLQTGEIFESNGVMLAALTRQCGAHVMMESHCRDDLVVLTHHLRNAAENDVVVISGGVSVGERDLVQQALRDIGAEIDLWRVAVKPGKPFLFGTLNRCAIFGLPGNPVSSFVTFLIFVRPALLQLMGAKDLQMRSAIAWLSHEVNGDDTRPHYLRGKLAGALFSVTGTQESHALFGLARSDALLRVAAGQKLSAGSEVEIFLLD